MRFFMRLWPATPACASGLRLRPAPSAFREPGAGREKTATSAFVLAFWFLLQYGVLIVCSPVFVSPSGDMIPPSYYFHFYLHWCSPVAFNHP
jgi:hypothetical protein